MLSFDIIALTETWLTPLVIDRLVSIDGYVMLHQDRDTSNCNGKKKKGGGIVIYVKSPFEPYNTIMHDLCNNTMGSEAIYCKPGNKELVI